MAKPFYRYLGGKSRELKYFKDLIPSYEMYIEPFFGGGAVYWDQEPLNAVISDNDAGLINFLRYVQTKPEIFNYVKNFWPCTKDYFLKVRDEWVYSGEEVEAQRYFYFLRTSFNGCLRFNKKKNKYNMSFGNKKIITGIPEDNIKILQKTIILNRDFRDVFKEFDSKNTFYFLDPPYDGLYNYLFDSSDKSDILVTLEDINIFMRGCKSKVLLTVNATPFTEKLFDGMICRRYLKTNSFGAHCSGKNLQIETLVVKNY